MIDIRPLKRGDAAPIFACARKNLDRFRPWFSWVTDDMQLAETQRYVAQVVGQGDPRRDYVFVLWDGENLAGSIGLHVVDPPNRTARIGYWLDAGYEGRGLMTNCVRSLVTKAFSELRLNRVEIRCAPENAASRAIPTRLGFTEEGTNRQALCINGGFQDLVMYAMVRRDWPECS